MRVKLLYGGAGLLLGVLFFVGCTSPGRMSGEELFKQRCAACHPTGGNTINPAKTLHKKDLAANHIETPGDIVGRMRNPGVGMPRFDANVIPDRDARKIASYILATFK